MLLAKELEPVDDFAIAAGVFPPYLVVAALLVAVFLWFRHVGLSSRTIFILALALLTDVVITSASASFLVDFDGPIFLFVVLPLSAFLVPLLTLVAIEKSLKSAREFGIQRLSN